MKMEQAVFRPGGNPLEDPAFSGRSARRADTDYVYPSARIRALETGLMDTARTMRLMEAQDTVEFGRLLSEAGYPAAETNGRSLNAGFTRACAVARDLSLEKGYIDLFYFEGDIINAKVFLKHFAGGETVSYDDLGSRIASPASVDPFRLYEAIRDKDPSGAHIPDWLWTAVMGAYADFAATGDGSRVDIRLDTAYAAESARIADVLGNAWFARYVAMRADLANLGMLLRSRRAGFTREFLHESLLPGGVVAPAAIEAMAGLPDDALTEAWRNTPYAALVAATASDYARTGGAGRFSKAADDLLMRHVREARRVSFGPEVAVAYVFAVQTEVRNARIILSFLRNQIDPAGARELLRETYL
ncbi:MAG TPA: V-type ATPase subunit [Clostridia bacterium]